MGAGSDPQVPAVAPVLHVVAAAAPRGRPVGDLVVVVPGAAQQLPRQAVHVRSQVGIGVRDTAILHPSGQRGALLQRQGVQGEVSRQEAQDTLEGAPPLGQGLGGQPVHQVQVYVLQAGGDRETIRRHRLGGGVAAAQQGQQGVVQALNTDAQPVHPRPLPALQRRARYVPRVGLESDLGNGRHVEGRGDALQHPCDLLRRDVGRGPAPEEYRGHRRMVQGLSPETYLGGQRVQVGGHQHFDALVRVEVAVGALGLAEGYVDVQGQPSLRTLLPGCLHVLNRHVTTAPIQVRTRPI